MLYILDDVNDLYSYAAEIRSVSEDASIADLLSTAEENVRLALANTGLPQSKMKGSPCHADPCRSRRVRIPLAGRNPRAQAPYAGRGRGDFRRVGR